MKIDVILCITNKETTEVREYEAYLDNEGNGEIILRDDPNHQNFNDLIDLIESGDYSLEVLYNNKIANATYELEYNCILISQDSQKRLLTFSKKIKQK